MDPLPIEVSFGTQGELDWKVLVSPFGDGYSQRTPDGINNEIETWNVVWTTLTKEEKTTLKNFFKALKGAGSFLWTAPHETEEKTWKVSGVKDSPQNAAIGDLSATFTRTYDVV